ncbi:MAG: hypothetical protein IT330_12330 [Anaerolineae bacterium]|nr:hypothetical protein [Anaerolineae bacterium]
MRARLRALEGLARKPHGFRFLASSLWTDNSDGAATANDGVTLPLAGLPDGALLIREEIVDNAPEEV